MLVTRQSDHRPGGCGTVDSQVAQNAEVAERCNALLADLATAPGTLIARAIASGLQTEASRAAAGDWMATLPAAVDDDVNE